ncbi:hypothetical protein [Phyllobacterium leguminum]|uniref:Uncharacterized protein n=1 Tax=Phyllobacterium leguminum TaxID=314237 RepID=A0A318T2M6_9HYPH|nr:hypothetical protein [Phyllobacterium leguminum]PYE88768.1 hypothetical protein C7477_106141 [Phyllobacterium leguminum]
MSNFDLRWLGMPQVPNYLTAQPNLMPQNMLTNPQPQSGPIIDLTATGSIPSKETIPKGGIMSAFEQPQGMVNSPVAVGRNDPNYFPPAPAANGPPITQQDYQASLRHLQPQQGAQQPAQARSGNSGGNFMETAAAFLQGLGSGNGVLSAIGGGLNAVNNVKKENQTVSYLTARGVPEGEAEILAQHPQAAIQVIQNLQKGADPKAALELQKLGLEVENLRNPQIKPTSDIQEYDFARRQGYQGTFSQYQQEIKKAGATNVTQNAAQDESEFAKKAAGRNVERFGALADAGTQSASVAQSIPVMRELLTQAPQGPVSGRLAEMFPGFSSAGDAFTAQVNQLAPTLRVPGSGALSDRDMDILMGSFPRLRGNPEANQMIMNIFERKAQLNAERGAIASGALRGEVTPAEADRRLAEIDKQPLLDERTRSILSNSGGNQNAPAAPQGVDPSLWGIMTPEERALWK